MTVFAHLPAVYHQLVPELEELNWPDEPRADCSACVMAPNPQKTDPFSFNPLTKCCTFHPYLVNYLAGRALNRGGASEAAVLARMRDPRGVTAAGVKATDAFLRRYRANRSGEFGRNPTLRCPYYGHSNLTCAIWPDREAACRIWFCVHEHGRFSARVWLLVQTLLSLLEARLARFCGAIGDPPHPPAGLEGFIAWYRRCAELVEAMTDDDALAIQCHELLELREQIRDAVAAPIPTIPDVVVPRVSWRQAYGDRVRLANYSIANAVVVPDTVYRFLSKLDGTRAWRDALAETHAEIETELDEADIKDMFESGVLQELNPAGEEHLDRPPDMPNPGEPLNLAFSRELSVPTVTE